MKDKDKSFWREVFSGANGIASSKRILGAFCLLVCTATIVYLAIESKDSDNVKDLIELLMGVSALLLGISSVTGIWKKTPPNDPK
jgi:hypothetical protein